MTAIRLLCALALCGCAVAANDKPISIDAEKFTDTVWTDITSEHRADIPDIPKDDFQIAETELEIEPVTEVLNNNPNEELAVANGAGQENDIQLRGQVKGAVDRYNMQEWEKDIMPTAWTNKAGAFPGCDEKAKHSLSDIGQYALWIGTFSMIGSACWFWNKSREMKEGTRMHYYMTFFVCAIASLAYLTMAYGYGIYMMPPDADWCVRPFYYARYVDWALTTPLMLLEICAIAGASNDAKLWLVGTDFFMIIAGLIGAFITTNEKWFFWIMGMLAFIPIIWYLQNPNGLKVFISQARATDGAELNDRKANLFGKVAYITAVFWCGYPLVWILAEGRGVISVDMECILYTILDVCSKCVFGFIILDAAHLQNRKDAQ